MAFHFEGFTAPNGTFVPDELFDVLAPELSEAELRVLLYIIRRTFGFKKSTDDISLKQMTEGITTREGRVLDRGTGLSKAGNARGIHGLIEKQVVTAKRNRTAETGDQATTYTLRFKATNNESGRRGGEQSEKPLSHTGDKTVVAPHVQTQQKVFTPVSTKETGGCLQERQEGVYHVDTQETVWQQTDFNLSNIRKQQAVQNANKTNVSPRPSHTNASPPRLSLGVFEPIGAVLERIQPAISETAESDTDVQEAIRAYIKDIAPRFNDQAPLESSVTRTYRLYKRANLPLGAFLSHLLGVASSVRERQSKVKKRTNGSKVTMPYYFACLEDRLCLRQKSKGVHTPQTSAFPLHASAQQRITGSTGAYTLPVPPTHIHQAETKHTLHTHPFAHLSAQPKDLSLEQSQNNTQPTSVSSP